MSPLTGRDFETIRRLALETTGIHLHEGKMTLVSSRLERLVCKRGFGSFGDYVRFLVSNRAGEEFSEFIDNLTTNHSGFWREPEHFEFLTNTILSGRRQGIRIWSAACATGEEPYTIAMCCGEAGTQASIAASDISRTALSAAARGEYEKSRLAALPPRWQNRYFEGPGAESGLFRVTRALRGLVRFGLFNLLQPLPEVGHFDVIFCRNVMIYFDQATRDGLVSRLIRQIVPGGYLLTGHSETLLKLPDGLSYIRPATYRKT